MNTESLLDKLCWYVIHTHPRQEKRAESNLKAWGVKTFNPQFIHYTYNEFTGRPTPIIKPLFPRYIFARLDMSQYHQKVRFTRGIHSVVSFNNVPCSVDDQIISLIEARIGDDGFVKMGEQLKPGDEVMIQAGPLKNLCGVFEREVKESDRIMILLETVNYQARVIIARENVKKSRAGQVA